MKETIDISTFLKVDIRTGTVLKAEPFKAARRPAYLLQIDFGPQIGTLQSSAQITELYTPDSLIGKQILAVVNLPRKQIATKMSECLVLGAKAPDGAVILLSTERSAPDGLPVS